MPPTQTASRDEQLIDRLRDWSVPLPSPDAPAFADAFESLGSARIVLLGEASHGSSEFYRARAAITRGLIKRHGFTPRRGRGRLAGFGPARCLCATAPGPAPGRAAVLALPHLDVAQRGGAKLHS